MSDQLENENQQSGTVTSQELHEFLLAELDAGKQVITTLSDERLEEIVGGGKINLSSIKKKLFGCFTCSGKQQTSEPVEWPTLPTRVYGPLGYPVGTTTIHTSGTSTGTGNKIWKPGLEPIPEKKPLNDKKKRAEIILL